MIIHKLDNNPSPHGESKYEAHMYCPRKARLDSEQRSTQTIANITGPFGVGTLFHAFAELYFTGKVTSPPDLHDVAFEGHIEIDREALYEAVRLFSEYMTHFPANHYGKVLGNEFTLPTPGEAQEKAAVEAAVGIVPWTGKVDMAVRLSKKSAEFLQLKFGLDVSPGKYLVDFKTDKAEYQNLREAYAWRGQFKCYIAAANAVELLYGRDPYLGLIADVTIKTKAPKFIRVLCEPPTPRELQAIYERRRAYAVMSTMLPDWANASAQTCFPIFGTCRHFLEGRCDRGPSEASMKPLFDIEALIANARKVKEVK